jgi:hypothetical protein
VFTSVSLFYSESVITIKLWPDVTLMRPTTLSAVSVRVVATVTVRNPFLAKDAARAGSYPWLRAGRSPLSRQKDCRSRPAAGRRRSTPSSRPERKGADPGWRRPPC